MKAPSIRSCSTGFGMPDRVILAGCRHPLFDRVSPVVVGGDYITTDSGTGLVHTAPGHGQDDYQARARLATINPNPNNGISL